MKHCQKLNREQKKLLTRNNLDSYDFYVIKSINNKGWLFQNKTNPELLLICYMDRNGVFKPDGETLFENI